MKTQHTNLLDHKASFPNEEPFRQETAPMGQACKQIRQHLLDANIVFKKVSLVLPSTSIQKNNRQILLTPTLRDTVFFS